MPTCTWSDSGTFPTGATANLTLTIAALRTADKIARNFKKGT
jgi:hypothetical protein